jgi:outer membrane immunogenic protein
MKRISLLALSTATTLFCSSAFAADVVAPDSEAFNWSGLYVGANAGYAWGNSEADGLYDGGDIVNGDFNPDGFVAGAQFGYNWQMDSNFVLGLEADLQYSDQHDDVNNPPGFDSEASAEVDVDWFGTLRARAGVALDRALLYATGGLAMGGVKYSVDDNFDEGIGNDKNTQWGWTAGLGAEYAITDMVTVKVEYLYVDLGKDDFSPASPPFDADVDTDFDVVRGGINILFQ